MQSDFEVAIIGGGPAGLSAALVLGRARRRAIVVDGGSPRNQAAPAMHSFLSRDGILPGKFRAVCHDELSSYSTIVRRAGVVADIRSTDRGFEVVMGDATVTSRKVILALGLVDTLPDINAGIGVVGAFEVTPMAHVRRVFNTNTLGVMAMTQAVIPQMRQRRSGVIVNVTSTVTLTSFPLAAAYTASKQAIQGFTGSLAHELAYFGIGAKLVEPGYGPTTRFAQNTDVKAEDLIPPEYQDFAAPIFQSFMNPQATTKESDVAEAVWAAVHDTSDRLHFPAGADAVELAKGRLSPSADRCHDRRSFRRRTSPTRLEPT